MTEFLTNFFNKTNDIVLQDITAIEVVPYKKLSEQEKKDILYILYRKITHAHKSEIKGIVKEYDDDMIFDFIKIHNTINFKMIFEDIIYYVTKYPDDMIMICVKNNIPIKVIETLAHKININYMDEKKETCLWKLQTNIDYLIGLLSSKLLNFDVNHKNVTNNTFICDYLELKILNSYFIKIMYILIEKNYDFNNILNGISILDKALLYNTDVSLIEILVRNTNQNITMYTLWLHILINKYDTKTLLTIIIIILKRPDYKIFLNEIMSKYTTLYGTSDNDMLLVMSIILHKEPNKLAEMLSYTNNYGNNILHIASSNHLDKSIRFIMKDNTFGKTLLIRNSDGKMPKDLYLDNDMLNLLHMDIKLF